MLSGLLLTERLVTGWPSPATLSDHRRKREISQPFFTRRDESRLSGRGSRGETPQLHCSSTGRRNAAVEPRTAEAGATDSSVEWYRDRPQAPPMDGGRGTGPA